MEEYVKNIHDDKRNKQPKLLLRKMSEKKTFYVVFDDFINIVSLKENEELENDKYIKLHYDLDREILPDGETFEILNDNHETFHEIVEKSKQINHQTLGIIQSEHKPL